jgi:DNA-binding response OmpR family regulator
MHKSEFLLLVSQALIPVYTAARKPAWGDNVEKGPRIVIIDDDPAHLRIYGWILERGGYAALPVLAQRNDLQLPNEPADLVVLDYALGSQLKAADVARQVKSALPEAPVVILSDLFGMPEDVAPLAVAFVQKGDPEDLLRTIASVLAGSNSA